MEVESMRAVLLAIAALLLTVPGCADDHAALGEPSPVVVGPGARAKEATVSPGSPPAGIRVVKNHRADLYLFVSNQSFIDDPVVLTISIDGTEVVAQPFEVGGQHNWILFPVRLPPGHHVLTAVSDTGVEIQQHFTSHPTEARHAVVDYWNYMDGHGRHMTWRIQSTPMAFD
jgi:hypothetical protein